MKNILTVLFLFFSSSVIAETYSCAVELSRFNQPGEIENKIYTREGYNFYNHHDWKFRIHFEDDNEIHLIKETTTYSMFIVMIEKKNLLFTEKFMSIEDAQTYETVPQVIGSCVVR